MPKHKKLLSGDKINNRHSTYTELAGKAIAELKKIEAVKKIVLGPIKPAPSAPRRIRVREDKGQARVQVRDSNAVQILWVIGVDAAVLELALNKLV